MLFNSIDFGDLELDDGCFIPDGDHVSRKGAVMTTRHLSSFPAHVALNIQSGRTAAGDDHPDAAATRAVFRRFIGRPIP
jgi:hypothetical protein